MVLLLIGVSAVSAAEPRTSTYWTSTNNDGVDVTPYVRVDKKALFVDFENFDNVAYVYYNLNYINKQNGVKGGVEGSFSHDARLYSGSFNGKNYIRREIIFGSCSSQNCVYHSPKNVILTVNTKMLEGQIDQYTKVLSIPDDQF